MFFSGCAYFNKYNAFLGLFGTNNVENSDDLRMPNGEVASDLVDFINSYELSEQDVCMIEDPSEVLTFDEEGNGENEKCSTFEPNKDQRKRKL